MGKPPAPFKGVRRTIKMALLQPPRSLACASASHFLGVSEIFFALLPIDHRPALVESARRRIGAAVGMLGGVTGDRRQIGGVLKAVLT